MEKIAYSSDTPQRAEILAAELDLFQFVGLMYLCSICPANSQKKTELRFACTGFHQYGEGLSATVHFGSLPTKKEEVLALHEKFFTEIAMCEPTKI